MSIVIFLPLLFTSPDDPITRSPDFCSFHNDRSRHIVVSSATNDAALHPELALFRGIKSYCDRLSRLDRLINAELLHLKPMLDVLAGYIQNHLFALVHADDLGFDSEFAHRDREMNGRTGLVPGARTQQFGTKNQQDAKLDAADQQCGDKLINLISDVCVLPFKISDSFVTNCTQNERHRIQSSGTTDRRARAG
jgi:hypothetical protein